METALIVASWLQPAFPPALMEQIIPFMVLGIAMALGFVLRNMRGDQKMED